MSALGPLVPHERTIYRAIRYKEQIQNNRKPKAKVFYLRPPNEEYLSCGVDAENARAGLEDVHAYCGLSVRDVIQRGASLGFELEVREVCAIPGKVGIYKMPMRSVDADGALKLAVELADIASEAVAY